MLITHLTRVQNLNHSLYYVVVLVHLGRYIIIYESTCRGHSWRMSKWSYNDNHTQSCVRLKRTLCVDEYCNTYSHEHSNCDARPRKIDTQNIFTSSAIHIGISRVHMYVCVCVCVPLSKYTFIYVQQNRSRRFSVISATQCKQKSAGGYWIFAAS